ncbi:MAG: flavodoxin domain-containing protein [Alphaproteobacteria bacterium]
MKILVLYASTEGQTQKIAEAVAGQIKATGNTVDLVDVGKEPDCDPADYDASILGASVHLGRYQASLVHFINDHVAALNNQPTVFVSVSLSAVSNEAEEREAIEAIANSLFDQTLWRPDQVHHAAGAFNFTQYDFFRRWSMKFIAMQRGEAVDMNADKEYTDWAALERFVADFLVALSDKSGG